MMKAETIEKLKAIKGRINPHNHDHSNAFSHYQIGTLEAMQARTEFVLDQLRAVVDALLEE